MKRILQLIVIGLLVFATTRDVVFAVETPTVGVIRFDAWDNSINPQVAPDYSKFGPQQWHYRLPFFTTWDSNGTPVLNGASQGNVDKEIQIADAAGISYFAFDYYPIIDWGWLINHQTTINYGLRDYLASTVPSNVKFALIIVSDGGVLGDVTKWNTSQVPQIVNLMKNQKYQTVLDGRALVYFFGADWTKYFGTKEAAKSALTTLRQQIAAATGKNPYFVSMDYDTDVAYFEFDARSGYLGLSDFTAKGASYQALTVSNLNYWNNLAQSGYQVIPLVSAGYDQRPRDPNYTGAGFQKGTAAEIAGNLQSAIQWIHTHPAITTPNSILLYAWNENIEGGWVMPTLFDGDARLEEIAKVIKGAYFTTPRFLGVDFTGDGNVDIYDYNILVSHFGKTGTNLAGDIDKNGKVDIFDYNSLVENFGK